MVGITAMAGESITVENLTVPQGKQGEMVVSFSFDEPHEYVSYQFTVELPSGVSLVADAYGKAAYELPDNQPAALFSVDFLASNGIVKVWSSPSTPIGGHADVLIRIPVRASADLAVGTTLSGRLTDVEFTKNTGAVRTPFADASFSITIAEPRIVFDENATSLPQYTTGEKENIKMIRTIKAGEWSTIVLPFTLSKAKVTEVFGEGVQLAEFTGFEVDYGDDETNNVPLAIEIHLKDYTVPRGGIAGGKPLLIKVTEDIESFEVDNVNITGTVTDVTKEDEVNGVSGCLTGSFVKTTIPEDGLFISDNKFWYSTGKTKVKAFRCWFELGAVLDKETDFGARISLRFDDEEAAGVRPSTAEIPKFTGQRRSYDLQGRRAVEPVKKGVYINNGKKVVIK